MNKKGQMMPAYTWAAQNSMSSPNKKRKKKKGKKEEYVSDLFG